MLSLPGFIKRPPANESGPWAQIIRMQGPAFFAANPSMLVRKGHVYQEVKEHCSSHNISKRLPTTPNLRVSCMRDVGNSLNRRTGTESLKSYDRSSITANRC